MESRLDPKMDCRFFCRVAQILKSRISRSDLSPPLLFEFTATRYGAKYNSKITLEHLKQPKWRPPAVEVSQKVSSPGNSQKGVSWKNTTQKIKHQNFLNSPRSVHVCMEFGVDPVTLLERELDEFKQEGLSDELVETAYQHHLETRTKMLDQMIAARAALPADFSPPSVGMDHSTPSFKLKSTPGEDSGDALLKERMLLDQAKQAKQHAKMEANRLSELAKKEKLQKEFAEKTVKVEARQRVLKKKAAAEEKERTEEQIKKTAENMCLAEIYEQDERAEALRRVDEETKAMAAEKKALVFQKRREQEKRLQSKARDDARAAKTAALRAKKEQETEQLRVQLEQRAKRLEQYERNVKEQQELRRTPRGPNLGGSTLKLSVSMNLTAKKAADTKHKQDLVQQRLFRDSNATSFRLENTDDEKIAAREAAGIAKRAKVAAAREEIERQRLEKFQQAKSKQEAYANKLDEEKKKLAEKVRFERVLRQNERTARVQNQERVKAVNKARLQRKIEEDYVRSDTLVVTKMDTAASRQLKNCRAGLEKSVKQQEEDEVSRKQTRERWLKLQEHDLELERRIEFEAEEKERLAAEKIAQDKAAAAEAVSQKHKRNASQASNVSYQPSEKRTLSVRGSRHPTPTGSRLQTPVDGAQREEGSRRGGSQRGGSQLSQLSPKAEVDDELGSEGEGVEVLGKAAAGEAGENGDAYARAPMLARLVSEAPSKQASESSFKTDSDFSVSGSKTEQVAPVVVEKQEVADVDEEDTVVA